MSLFTMNDEEAGKPKYLSDADKALTFGVDRAEAANPTNRAKGIKTPGWNKIVSYTDAQGKLRNKVEVLVVAGGDMTGDLDGSGADIGTGGGGGALTYPLSLSLLHSSPPALISDRCLRFNPTGTVAYQVESTQIYAYSLSTPWDLTTLTYNNSYDLNPLFMGLKLARNGFEFDPTGSFINVILDNAGMGYPARLNLSNPWDITSISTISEFQTVSLPPGYPDGLTFSSNGTTAYVINSGNVYSYNLPSPYDWTGVGSYSSAFNLVGNLGLYNYPHSITFSSDGTIGAVFQSGMSYTGVITQFELAVPFDITTINFSTAISTELSAGYGYMGTGSIHFDKSDTEIIVAATASNMMSKFATAYTI